MPDNETFDDPFVDVGEIPAGLSYQWCALSVMGFPHLAQMQISKMKRGGWGPVPAKRHPKMRHVKGWIIVQNQLLVQKPKRLVDAENEQLKAVALAMAERHKTGDYVPGFPMTEPTGFADDLPSRDAVIAVKEKMRRVDGLGNPIAEFDVKLGLPLSDSEVEMSLCLKLDVGEYARRKFLMLADVIRRISGFDNGRTVPVFDFIALEPGKSK